MKPDVGQFYTMSENKRYRDRSWLHYIWDIVAVNETHAVIVAVAGCSSYSSFGKEPQIVAISEFDWTPAGNLVSAMADYVKSESARG